MPRRNSVRSKFLEPHHSQSSILRIAAVICIASLAFQSVGQEETVEESDETKADGISVQETAEDLATEESDVDAEDSVDETIESPETDTNAEESASVEDSANNENPSNSEELEESDDAAADVFTPTEELSEDVPIAFPVDI